MNIDKTFANNTALIDLVGRLLLVSLFILSGLGKVDHYSSSEAYMMSKGVPGFLLPVAIALEVLGGLAVALGWKTRLFAFMLAGFSVLTAILFHADFAGGDELYGFTKNLGLAGGFLILVAHGAGGFSLDARRQT